MIVVNMKRTIFALAIMVMAASSCSKDAPVSEGHFNVVDAVSASSFRDCEPEWSRTYIDFGELKHFWSEGDAIAVFSGNSTGVEFVLNEGAYSAQGQFVSRSLLSDSSVYYAVYPYSAASKCTFSPEGDVIAVEYPSSLVFNQDDPDNLYAGGANLMVACSGDHTFGFKNLCSYVELMIYGSEEDALKSIAVTGKNDEILSGKADVTFDEEGDPQVKFVSGGKSVSVDFGAEGQPFDSGLLIDVSVPPVLSEGFVVTLTTVNGVVKSFRSDESSSLLINQIISMEEIHLDD